MPLSRNRRAVAAMVVLCLAVLAQASPGAASDQVVPTTTTATGSNPGVGALRLSAVASSEQQSYSDGVMVFEVDGRKPVTVPVGRYVVVGRSGDLPAPDEFTAVADFTGLQAQGTYPATATFVPDQGSGAEGSEAGVTTTLTRTVDRSTVVFNPNARGRAVELLYSVQAYPPNAVVGSLVIRDLNHRGVVVAQQRRVRAGRAGFATIRNVSRGLHRYRARFTPLPRLADTLRGSIATVDIAVGS